MHSVGRAHRQQTDAQSLTYSKQCEGYSRMGTSTHVLGGTGFDAAVRTRRQHQGATNTEGNDAAVLAAAKSTQWKPLCRLRCFCRSSRTRCRSRSATSGPIHSARTRGWSRSPTERCPPFHTHTHAHTRVRAHTRSHTHTHPHTHTRARTLARTHTRAPSHAHKCARTCVSPNASIGRC